MPNKNNFFLYRKIVLIENAMCYYNNIISITNDQSLLLAFLMYKKWSHLKSKKKDSMAYYIECVLRLPKNH